MLKLVLPNDQGAGLFTAQATLPIRWCLDREDMVALKGKEDVRILLVVSYENGQEDRQLVPIDQLIAYVSFRFPGTHQIFAKLMYPGDGVTLQSMTVHFLRGSVRNCYDLPVLNGERTGFLIGRMQSLYDCPSESPLVAEPRRVSVPKEYFAKEYPAWLMRIVNAGYRYPPVDTCDFRKRGLVTPLKFLWYGIWSIITTAIRLVAVFVLAFCGMRGIGFGAVIHPWRDDISDTWYRTGGSWFLEDKHGYARFHYLFLHPTLWTGSGWLVYHYRFRLAAFFLRAWPAILGIAAVLGVVILLLAWLLKRAEKKREWRSTAEYRKLQKTRKEREFDELSALLACPAVSRSNVGLAAIPKERRTFHLRFLDLKAKVCRPFAG